MKRKHLRKLGMLFVLAVGVFQLPRLAIANHGEEEEATPTGGGSLVFDIGGCTPTQ